jgi:hypothetical protein
MIDGNGEYFIQTLRTLREGRCLAAAKVPEERCAHFYLGRDGRLTLTQLGAATPGLFDPTGTDPEPES